MRKTMIVLLATLFVAATAYGMSAKVFFSPPGGEDAELVKTINAAKKSVYVQAYDFTLTDVAKALVTAKKRGLDVWVIQDKRASTGANSVYPLLAGMVCTDAKHTVAHNKVLIVDSSILFIGSYNFTNNAEKYNAENMLEITDAPELVNAYTANFRLHKEHCK